MTNRGHETKVWEVLRKQGRISTETREETRLVVEHLRNASLRDILHSKDRRTTQMYKELAEEELFERAVLGKKKRNLW